MQTIETIVPWQKLQEHQRAICKQNLNQWFAEDPVRFQKFSLEAAGLFLDYSKNHITPQTLALLFELGNARQLKQRITELFNGAIVNKSENRPALHTALRYSGTNPLYVDGVNIISVIQQTLKKVETTTNLIRSGQYLGYSGKPINTILHFGIGGSDLGPLLVYEALEAYRAKHLEFQFFSYQDPEYVKKTLAMYDPATTLIIIASKSFTTAETLANAKVAMDWLLSASQGKANSQIIAVTAKSAKAIEFGIAPEQIFPIWDWVGGRYSVWSAMSLVVAIAIGFEHFKAFLSGAEALDQHFHDNEWQNNIPVILGLLDIWYNNFFAIPHRAVIPYGRTLRHLPDHLQQVYMESLGKRVDQQNKAVNYVTGFVIWGGTGTNSQHSFHQLLLQGNQCSPIDFVLPFDNLDLAANCLAQSQVLMTGYYPSEEGPQVILGNRPSHTIAFPEVSPRILGALLALYEHRIYVNSVIWNINAFDQWGVERGKQIAKNILADFASTSISDYDHSTTGLIDFIKRR